jgi:predicted secreted protein
MMESRRAPSLTFPPTPTSMRSWRLEAEQGSSRWRRVEQQAETDEGEGIALDEAAETS